MLNQKKKVLVLGATGLLGQELVSGKYFKDSKIYKHGFGSTAEVKADLTNYENTVELLSSIKPDTVINLVALTDVDYCESHPHEAFKVNARSIEYIAQANSLLHKPANIIHISTDQVYDGEGPHLEKDVNPSNYYSFSKYISELIVLRYGGMVLRTNFFGKSRIKKRKSFTDWLFEQMTSESKTDIFTDVYFSPLSSAKLCEIIDVLSRNFITGVFNVGSHHGMSKADFALQFAEHLSIYPTNFILSKMQESNYIKAYRPSDMRMNPTNFEDTFGIKLPLLESEIKLVAKDYYDGL